MARIRFRFDVDADLDAAASAVGTAEGIAGWWTDQTELRDGTLVVRFPGNSTPVTFDVERTHNRVSWRHVGDFPPHWVGTVVRWDLEQRDGRSTVLLDHDGFATDDPPLPDVAYTWSRLLPRLVGFVEAGERQPLFTTDEPAPRRLSERTG